MYFMAWSMDPDRPIYLQILERVQYDIVSGHYLPGEQLPSVRELALDAAVNPNTIQKALSALEQSGLLFSQRTQGRFVTKDAAVIHETRMQLAKNQMTKAIRKMKKLGFQKQEILQLVEALYEEVRHEHASGNT